MAKAKTSRIGLKWRDGRPRWEPSPTNRQLGVRGRDLRDGQRWLTKGEAADVAGARTELAGILRSTLQDAGGLDPGVYARNYLRKREARPQTSTGELVTQLNADLLQRLQGIAAGAEDVRQAETEPEGRTVADMVARYFADPTINDPHLGRRPATLQAYRIQSKKLIEKFGGDQVRDVRPGQLRSWYVDLTRSHSLSTAKQVMGATSAFFTFARVQLDWIGTNPAAELDIRKPAGRRVLWSMEQEAKFVAWCDKHGFADVGDAVTAGCWLGARSGDLCHASLADLAGDSWRFVPEKTARMGREAMPGIGPQVRARLAVRQLDPPDTPFLLRSDGTAHDSRSIGHRFRDARTLAIKEMPDVEDLMLKDTRKTCVTRLALSGVELARIYQWTGHSPDEALAILRESYIVLTKEGSDSMAQQLQAWAANQGIELQ